MTKHRKKRSSLSYKDIQIIYLSHGIEAISKIHKTGEVSALAFQHAFDQLKATGKAIVPFRKWIIKNLPAKRRGKKPPLSGLERIYRAQKIRNNTPFLRLPLDCLQIKKGQRISVVFEDNRIIVKKLT